MTEDSATAVCRECDKRFPLTRRSNQHQRASGAHHKGSRFCSAACKQLAYRKRNANRLKSAPGINTHATVTRPLQPIENIGGIRGQKTVLDVEIFAPHRWEPRRSSGGVPIMVARLGKSALVRNA